MKHILMIAMVVMALSCTNEPDPFLVTKHSVGNLTDSTQVKDLDILFPNDSIVKFIGGDEFTGNINDIDIYEPSGKLLLVLTPNEALDSTSTFKTVRIVDPRYKTAKGLSVNSAYKDLHENYKINKIQNTLSNVVLTVNELNAYLTIDKKELPSNMQFDMNLKIDPIQIPDNAKIKNFYLHWY